MKHVVTARIQIDRDRWLAFRDPVLVLQADSAESVVRTLVDVEQLTRDRALHAVGFLTFEAADAFELPTLRAEGELPLAWFALFERSAVDTVGPPESAGEFQLGPLTPTLDRDAFASAFARIKEHLAAGDTYQVNFTFAMWAAFEGDAFAFFARLTRAQRGGYGAYIDLGDRVIASASPELFFEFSGPDIVTRPMKGTARRGMTLEEDRAIAAALAASDKERAENVMIVDMLRNDLGRVADTGTVVVPDLFRVERFPNVWQMTSEVRARSLAPLETIFAALHPSASVTGAPKRRTMEIIRSLEQSPRGLYTGAIGHVPPDGLARFNVAIRTALIDRRTGALSYGVGSGIVWDSEVESEYAECLMKASVLAEEVEPFALLETLRWTPDEGCYLLERHLERLARAAEYFDVPLDLVVVRRALEAVSGAGAGLRVRVLVSQTGEVRIESHPLVRDDRTLRVCLSTDAVSTRDPFLYHKTTHRAVYERARAQAPTVDEVLLWNERGEVTEATTCNVVVELDGVRVTPPISSGLLAGTFRAEMLERGDVEECVVLVHDLPRATGLWLVNSVHGMRPADLLPRT